MIQYISEFGLPKEFSKKKKFDLLIGMFIPKEEWKDQQIDWNINMDLQAVYLTIEDCSRNVIDTLLNNGKTADDLKYSYIAIASFTYPATSLNDIALARDPQNHAIDCEFSKESLRFNFTFRGNPWESISISTLKIGNITTVMEDNGHIKVTDFNVYPVIDNTMM